MRGLDCGCGTGGPSREIALFASVHITGISINQIHVDRATAYAKHEGLSRLVDHKVGDFMVRPPHFLSFPSPTSPSPFSWSPVANAARKIPFPDNYFDFIFSTEATVYAPSLSACYTEIARVLKPSGVFGTYEWLLTPLFNPHNPTHLEIRHRIERGDGVTNLLTIPDGLAAFAASGLEMFHCEDLAERGAADKKWWSAIDGDVAKTTNWGDWWLVFKPKEGFFDFAFRFTKVMDWLGQAPNRGFV